MLRQAKNITSPWSGETVRPVIREVKVGGATITEAHYVCPTTNRFITKIQLGVKKDS